MKRKLILSCSLLIGLVSNQFAQDRISPIYSPKIELSGLYSINSTAVTASFYEGLYSGKFIDGAAKEQVSKRLSAQNLFGAEAASKIIYHSSPLFNRWEIYAGASYNLDFGMQFSTDLFKVIFYGNNDYADKKADFTGTEVKYMESQSLHFGFCKHLSGDSASVNRTIQLGLNVVNGQNLYDIKMDRASIFTEKNGTYLDIDAKGNMYQSDVSGTLNGIGAGLNFSYEVEKKKGARFLVELNNLGLMQWNKNTVHDYIDTTLRFEGFVVSNIFAIQDSTFNNVSAESASKNLHTESKTYTTALPFTIHAKYLYPLNNKSYLGADLNYKYWGTYIPKLILSYGYNFGHRFTVEATGGYGGYGQLHAGLNAKINFNKDFNVRIGASDLLGFIAPSSFSNQGAFLLASYIF
ncbi:MAG: DUF5723 family protein [Bacteroidetes bacterium]|nr:DUF5723 family protein [Bacteroidota bacterium]